MLEKNRVLLTDEQILHYLWAIPKVELHIHIEGTIKPETVLQLVKKNRIDSNINQLSDVKKLFDTNSLSEFIHLFLFVQSCFKEIEDFTLLMDDAIDYFSRNNVRYAEIFFAPSKFVQNGFSFDEIIDVFCQRIKVAEQENQIEIRLLIDVSRTFGPENAMKNLDMVLKTQCHHIIGIGMGGDEQKGPAKEYQQVFEKAIQNGLCAVAHSGEDVGPESIWNTIRYLNIMRIGHGISSILDDKLMQELKDRNLPLEISPTSNIFTQKFVKRMEEHPVRAFFDRGIPVSINSDDPTFFNINISEEYFNLFKHLNFTIDEINQIVLSTIDQSFYYDKIALKRQFQEVISEQMRLHIT